MALRTHYFLAAFSDEVSPCAPTLEAWAEWLAKPAPDWNRPQACAAGEVFTCTTDVVLAEVEVECRDGQWLTLSPLPEGAEWFVLCDGPGGRWDQDQMGVTIADALDDLDDADGERAWLAVCRDGPKLEVRFDQAPDGPRLAILSQAGRA